MHVLFQLALALACPAIILPASCEYYRPRRASPKTTLKDIIVFGDSFADNGLCICSHSCQESSDVC